MSNTLRLFIRESLTNEAVGQETWIRKDPFITSVTKDSSLTSKTMEKLGAVGKALWGKTKGHAGRAARTRAGRVATAAAGVSLLGLAIDFGAGWWKKMSDTKSDPDAARDEFEAKIVEIISDNQEEIIKKLRTPSFVAGLTLNSDDAAMTKAIDEYEANYEKYASAIIAAANTKSYDGFFQNIPAYSSCKAALDTEISAQSSNDPAATKNFKSFVFSYLIYSSIAFCFQISEDSACNRDINELTSKNFIADNSSNATLYENFKRVETINIDQSNKINNNTNCQAAITEFET